MTKRTVDETLDSIRLRDAEARKASEKELLKEATSLTNGKTGCTVTQGKVLLGLATKVIEISSNTREIIAILPNLQTKKECSDLQTSHVKGFNLSTNVTILTTAAMLIGLLGKFLNWW